MMQYESDHRTAAADRLRRRLAEMSRTDILDFVEEIRDEYLGMANQFRGWADVDRIHGRLGSAEGYARNEAESRRRFEVTDALHGVLISIPASEDWRATLAGVLMAGGSGSEKEG